MLQRLHLRRCTLTGQEEPLLLVFWATWCTPCITEIPVLRELHDDPSLQLQIVSVSLDAFLG